MHTKWAILHDHDITPGQLDEQGTVRQDVMAAWLDGARDAYLDLCPLLKANMTGVRMKAPARALGGSPDGVAVSATAAEIQPDAVTISLRVRSADQIVDTRCTIRVTESKEIRDELIANEHGARYYN